MDHARVYLEQATIRYLEEKMVAVECLSSGGHGEPLRLQFFLKDVTITLFEKLILPEIESLAEKYSKEVAHEWTDPDGGSAQWMLAFEYLDKGEGA